MDEKSRERKTKLGVHITQNNQEFSTGKLTCRVPGREQNKYIDKGE